MSQVRGQVAVEAALVLPLFVFFTLGLVQLTLMQQARLLTEYGAFQAARAGSVWNGHLERMRHAALVALVPSFGPSSSPERLARTRERLLERDLWVGERPWPGERRLNGVPTRGLVEVALVSPTLEELAARGVQRQWQELDFDAPGVEELTLRVRYWFPLRVPWANAWFFQAWSMARGLRGADAELATVRSIAASAGTPEDVRYLVPLTAEYRMRWQSNPYRKWIPERAP